MRVMIDTNILISAALFPKGKAAEALMKALVAPYEPVICEYVLEEFKRKFEEKFHDSVPAMEAFLLMFIPQVELVPTPKDAVKEEGGIRDPKDRPILRAALNSHAELFLTGDKDFLESSITDPRIISVSDFIEL